MQEKTIHISNISCNHCMVTIRRELEELEGVEVLGEDLKLKQLTIRWNKSKTWKDISKALSQIGYPAQE